MQIDILRSNFEAIPEKIFRADVIAGFLIKR